MRGVNVLGSFPSRETMTIFLGIFLKMACLQLSHGTSLKELSLGRHSLDLQRNHFLDEKETPLLIFVNLGVADKPEGDLLGKDTEQSVRPAGPEQPCW